MRDWAAFCEQPYLILEVLLEPVLLFRIKRKHKYKKNLKNVSSKNKFPGSLKSTKIYCSKYICYISVMNMLKNSDLFWIRILIYIRNIYNERPELCHFKIKKNC